MPDEEIGGSDGMAKFVKSQEFLSLNPGFALDEGLANENDAFKVYYGERSPWWIEVTAQGGAGHASKFIDSGMARLLKTLNKFSAFRESEETRLNLYKTPDGQCLKLGDVTTTNITLLTGGVQMNVVPASVTAGIDMRLSPLLDFEKFEEMIHSWCEPGVTIKFLQKTPKTPFTHLNDANKEWKILQKVAEQHKIKLETEIFPASTDSRFLRQVGVPALGISAIKNTPVLLHDHDEFLNEQVFIDGIGFYADLISGIANVE